MRLIYLLSLLLFPIQQASAAHYNFSQIFSGQEAVKGSFDVNASTGIVNENQISNFSISFVDYLGWGGHEDSRQISFNIETKQLALTVESSDVEIIFDPGGEEFHRINTYRYAGRLPGEGVFGVFYRDCRVEPFGTIDVSCKGFPGFTLVTSNPVIVSQVVPLPGAFGLFSFGMVLTSFINRRFRRYRISAV